MEMIMQRESPVVIMIRMGGGKSLLFILLAWCGREETSIIMMPLVALWQDLKDHYEWLKLKCVKWSYQ
jgi:superfamily II DNA helicase RecQ